MDTPLHRVETLLQRSDIGLTVHSIMKEAKPLIVPEKVAANTEASPAPQPTTDLPEPESVQESPRFAIAIPKRPLRVVRSAERARELALAAVCKGAVTAQVFELVPVGHATRAADWQGMRR